MNGQLREKVIRNCSDKWSRQYQPDGLGVRVWQKLGPEHVIKLLEDAAAPARAEANALLRQLASAPWRISATVHSGGKGDATRAADPNAHITVSVGGRGYHLRCREQPGLHVIAITA